MEKNHRNVKIDFLKGFAIFLVVWGHVIQYVNNNEFDFFKHPIFIFIYTFHMPLFMFISGYLFSYSINRRNYKEMFLDKIKKMIIPIIAWTVLTSIITAIVKLLLSKENNILKDFILNLKSLPYQLWFLWAIFYCSLVIIIGKKYFRDSKIFYILMMIFMILTPDYINFHLYKFVYPYFVIGYFFNSFRGFVNKNIVTIKKVVFIFFPIMLLGWKKDYYVYISRISILGKNPISQLENILYRYSMGMLGILFVVILINYYFKYINIKLLNDIFCTFGMYSLGIYIISMYFMEILEYIYIPIKDMFIYNLLVTPSISIGIIIFCIFITKKIECRFYLKKILLGK